MKNNGKTYRLNPKSAISLARSALDFSEILGQSVKKYETNKSKK
jgi:hypothetical protein